MKKGGAPLKKEQLKLKNRIILSFNESEYNMLLEKGMPEGRTIKTIIMNAISGKTTHINTNKDPKYIFELNRIGNNLNQLTKLQHINDQLSDNDIRNLWSLLNIIEKLLTE